MCGARSTGAALLSVNFHPPPLSRQDFPSLLSSVARSASGLLREGENMHWKTAIPPAHQVLHEEDGGKPRLPVYLARQPGLRPETPGLSDAMHRKLMQLVTPQQPACQGACSETFLL